MADPVRVGVIGTSWWADLFHLPSLKSHSGAELAAICGRNRARADELAQKYAIPLVFSDYREMIGRGGLQALVIATPDDQHYQMALDALDAGLHVICEKPLALDATQAREMCERAEARGVKHMTFFTWRWMPHFQLLRDLVAGGFIGRCYDCQLRFLGGYARGGQYAWRFDPHRANGIVGDLGSHLLDLARWIVGDISRVSAHLSSNVERPGADGQPAESANDTAALLVEFANGAHGTIQTSATAHVGDRGVEQAVVLHGSAGSLEVQVHFGGPQAGAHISGVRNGEEAWQSLAVPETLWGNVDRSLPFDAQIDDLFCKQSVGGRQFIDAIRRGDPISPSFFDGLKAQQAIDAAIESHLTGRWVALPSDSSGA